MLEKIGNAPVVCVSALLAAWLVVVFGSSLRRPPVRFFRLETPSRRQRTIYGKRSQKVQDVFESRLECRWFGLKYFAATAFLDRGSGSVWAWTSILDDTMYAELRPRYALTVGGYASRSSKQDARLVVGLETWLLKLGAFCRSAADHELIHCAQQVFERAIDQEWDIVPRRRGWWWRYEFTATFIGGPLWGFAALGLLLGPIVAGSYVVIGF